MSTVFRQTLTKCLAVTALFAVALAVVLFAIVAPSKASAAPSDDKQAEADAALEQLTSLQSQLDEASNAYFEALAVQEEAQANMDAAEEKIQETNAKIDSLQDKLSSRAVDMYKSGSPNFLTILLGSQSIKEFVTGWEALNQINEKDAAMVEEAKALKEEAEAQKMEFAKQEEIAAEKTAEALNIKNEAETLVADMQATYDSLSAEAAELLASETAASTSYYSYTDYSSYNGVEPAYNAVTGNAVVDRAYSYVGNAEYVWGGCSPGAFDCSGFVSYCLSGQYTRLGTTWTFLTWPQTWDPQPGDVCTNEQHCGIYIGNGMMIHCATYGVGVIIGPVQSGMTYHRWQ